MLGRSFLFVEDAKATDSVERIRLIAGDRFADVFVNDELVFSVIKQHVRAGERALVVVDNGAN